MTLTKQEKNALFELLDAMTNRCPEVWLPSLETPYYNAIFWNIFKKLRLELKGF